MIVYMNVLDGLAHNTGPIMDKMTDLEAELNDKGKNSNES